MDRFSFSSPLSQLFLQFMSLPSTEEFLKEQIQLIKAQMPDSNQNGLSPNQINENVVSTAKDKGTPMDLFASDQNGHTFEPQSTQNLCLDPKLSPLQTDMVTDTFQPSNNNKTNGILCVHIDSSATQKTKVQ